LFLLSVDLQTIEGVKAFETGGDYQPGALAMDIPLDLERKCEQRWAARFPRVPQEHRDTPRQQQQAATGKEQGKTRQVGSAGSSSALGGVFKPPR
jgi:hypothetical protein